MLPAHDVLSWATEATLGQPFPAYVGLDRIQANLAADTTTGIIRCALEDPTAAVVIGSGPSGIEALTCLLDKPMETEHFGLSVAALPGVIAQGSRAGRSTAIGDLLRRSRALAREREIEMLVLRVDSGDVEALDAAQRSGFSVHEATITWLADSRLASEAPAGDDISVTVYDADRTGAVEPEVVEALADTTSQWVLSHYGADPRLPCDGVSAFYRAWIANIVDGHWSDRLIVARSEGRVVGLYSEVSDPNVLRHHGVDLRCGEWVVVLQAGTGAGRALMAAAGRHPHPGGPFRTWETQARNLPTIRCIEQTGVARPIRSTYTLHAWPRSD